MGGCAPGPGAAHGPHPGRLLPVAALPSPSGFARLPGLAFVPPRRLRRRPGLLPSPRPAGPGPLPLPSAAAGRRARRRASFAAPPSPPLGRLCARTRSAGARCRRLPAAPALLRCGLPARSPLLRAALGLVQRVGSRGLSLGPLRGKRRGSSGPAPVGGLRWRSGRFPARLSGVTWCAVFSPAPPRPAAPAGGSGERVACSRWPSAPRCVGRASRAPLAGPPSPGSDPPVGVFGPVDTPKTVNRCCAGGPAGPHPGPDLHAACSRPAAALPLSHPRQGCPSAGPGYSLGPALTRPGREICPAGLTFPARCATMSVRGLFRPFGGRPFGGVRGQTRAPSGDPGWGSFFAPVPCHRAPPLPYSILDHLPANATKPLSFCCV